MTELAPQPEGDVAAASAGGSATNDPVSKAMAMLEMLSPEARESVLSRMNDEVASRIRLRLESTPDERPHGAFSADVAERRRMVREVAERVHARRTDVADRAVAQLDAAAGPNAAFAVAVPDHLAGPHARANAGAGPQASDAQAKPLDPLDTLRTLHPAAIARAMQGERAEAWAIVLDRLDVNARAALQMYLDGSARAAIGEARARQHELSSSAPALLATIERAIARTVVPRAMREHHTLLSTSAPYSPMG